MSRLLGRIVHWIAVVLLLIAGALLLVTTISAPVISDIAILKVELKNHSAITFGSFGHCILNVAPAASGQDYCPPKTIGYAPASIIGFIDYTTFPLQKSSAADDLTYSFVLHPIACAIAFSAALCGCVGVIGAFSGSLVALLAFLTALIVMAMDFAAFGIIKAHVNSKSDDSGSHASYAAGMWTCLAAVILLFVAMLMMLFGGCSERKKGSSRHTESWSGNEHYEKNEHTTPYTRRNHEKLKAGKPYENSQSPAPTAETVISEGSTKVATNSTGSIPKAEKPLGKEVVICDECGNKMTICKKCGNRTNYPYGNGRPSVDYAAARKSRLRTEQANSVPQIPSKRISEGSSNGKPGNNYESGLHPSPALGYGNSSTSTALQPSRTAFQPASTALQPTSTALQPSRASDHGNTTDTAYPESAALRPQTPRVHDYGDTSNNKTNYYSGLNSNSGHHLTNTSNNYNRDTNTQTTTTTVRAGPMSAKTLGSNRGTEDEYGQGRGSIAPVHDRVTNTQPGRAF